MLKKTILLASMASAAFTVPTMASAAGTLTHEGVPVPTNETVSAQVSGFVEIDLPALESGYGCEAEAEVELVSGHPSTGTSVLEIPSTDNCQGTGLLAGCELEAHESNGPFDVVAGANDFTVTNPGGVMTLSSAFDENCIVPGGEMTFAEVLVTPDNTESISSVTLSGEGVDDVTELALTVTGELAVEPAGTYGIE